MNFKSSFRGALRRIQGTRAPAWALLRESLAIARKPKVNIDAGTSRRRTAALPATMTNYSARADVLPKATPVNLRKFSETPVARKAINSIKDRVACMGWRIQPKDGLAIEEVPDGKARVRILTDNFASLNYDKNTSLNSFKF